METSLIIIRRTFVAWLNAGQPKQLDDALRVWITARVAKVLALHASETPDVARDMAVMGVASGLDTDERTAHRLCGLAATPAPALNRASR